MDNVADATMRPDSIVAAMRTVSSPFAAWWTALPDVMIVRMTTSVALNYAMRMMDVVQAANRPCRAWPVSAGAAWRPLRRFAIETPVVVVPAKRASADLGAFSFASMASA